jgi:hypothetical protein
MTKAGPTPPRGCEGEDPPGGFRLAGIKFFSSIDQVAFPRNAKGFFFESNTSVELLCHDHGYESLPMMLHLGVLASG